MKRKLLHSLAALALYLGILGHVVPEGTARAEEGAPAVANNGFEDVSPDGSVPGWAPYGSSTGVTVTGGVYGQAYGGTKSALIRDNDPAKSAGIESGYLSLVPYGNYSVSSMVYTEHTSARLSIRFYDEAGAFISSVTTNPSPVERKWNPVRLSFTVPHDAAKTSIVVLTTNAGTGIVYADDVHLVKDADAPGTITNLGMQVNKTYIMRGAFGKDHTGRDVMYTVMQGDPGALVVMDVKTETVIARHVLPETQETWAIYADDNGHFYSVSSIKAYMYRYSTRTDKVELVGNVASGQSISWVLVPGENGVIYGGTGYDNKVYEFDPAKALPGHPAAGLTDHGSMTKLTGVKQNFVRSLAYDGVEDVLYAGLGEHSAELIKYNPRTKTRESVLPALFANQTPKEVGVYDLQLVGDKLFARFDKSNRSFVMNIRDGSLINSDPGFKIDSRGWSAKSPVANKVYYVYQSSLHEYDLDTNTFKNLHIDTGQALIGFGYVQLDKPGYPGYSLVGFSGVSGKFFKYNLETGNNEVTELPLPPQPVKIHHIFKGPDGRIYTGGFLGGTGVYKPTADAVESYAGVGQAEGAASLGGQLFIGSYPYSRIWKYDPAKPRRISSPANYATDNPYIGISYSSSRTADRPLAMVGVEELGKVFIGTVPTAGKLGGLLIYARPTDASPGIVKEAEYKPVPNHSILSLVYKNGMLIGGTSIRGGEGAYATDIDANDKSGKLFIWDVAKKTKVFETVVVNGYGAVPSLIEGPDGNIWGIAGDTLFIFDPVQRKIVYNERKFPGVSHTSWTNGFLELGTDGHLYGTIGKGSVAEHENTFASSFFKIDTSTREVTVLLHTGAERLAQDDFGDFYFKTGGNLFRYHDPNLAVKLSGAEITVDHDSIPIGMTATMKVKGILEKGRTTYELSGASKEYVTSDPSVVSIADGVITAKKKGKADVWVKVALDGRTVASNKITITVPASGPLSSDATLQDLRVDNRTVAGFVYDTFDYTVELPYGTDVVPPVTAIAANERAQVTVRPAASLPGTSTITVTAENGNALAYQIRFTLARDVTAPITTVQVDPTGPIEWHRAPVSLTLVARDDLSGVSGTEYQLNGEPDWKPYLGPISISDEGIFQLFYRSVDRAGNVEETKERTVRIDNTAPSYALTVNGIPYADGTAYGDDQTLTFQLAATDALSGLADQTMTLDGQPYGNGTVVDLAGKLGVHSLRIVLTDQAGNVADTTLTFAVETSIKSILNLLQRYVDSGELQGAHIRLLKNKLNQANHQASKGSYDTAAKFVGEALQQLNEKTKPLVISETAKTALTADLQALWDAWSER
ncbi:cadherin-like beta sandwich domain-containing protein [Paenibacillus sp. GYB003]|uniref:cadherin-like beta sandwich domain-containing protein n=1 Tax=Paenibacillus sp. GYB003 TaxID=2994392 RepID=UPI002F967495